YRPQHIFFGATIFLLSVGTALLGLKEALLFKLSFSLPLTPAGTSIARLSPRVSWPMCWACCWPASVGRCSTS
ncbi:CYB561 isoform 8, partial [Pongo abelii]